MRYDIAVVGAGPAGTATAIGALQADPTLSVLLLDRSDFPRDKACGDGIAPQILDLLADAGVTGLLDDQVPVTRLRLERRGSVVEREMERPTYVVPRTLLDARLVEAAQTAGARLQRHRVRRVVEARGEVVLDGGPVARVVVGADGAHSVVRRTLGCARPPTALAIRGYAPTPPERSGVQAIVFGDARQPAYAWSFDRGDGLSNVGYGELLGDGPGREQPSRAAYLEQLEALLPGSTSDGTAWRGHPLPLSGWRPPALGRGRLLLTGDAAALVNPMTGEGIYYAVATGLQAGAAAAAALAAGEPASAAARYARLVRPALGRHLRHSALVARLARHDRVLDAGIRASAAEQEVFDGFVDLGLAAGPITPTMVRGLFRVSRFGPRTHRPEEAHA